MSTTVSTLLELDAIRDTLDGDYELSNNIDTKWTNVEVMKGENEWDIGTLYHLGDIVKKTTVISPLQIFVCICIVANSMGENPIVVSTSWTILWAFNDSDIDPTVHSVYGWLPIGASATPFTGTFDGKEYTISNLYINRATTDYIGLFGCIEGGTIENLTISNCEINGKDKVGSLVGSAETGAIITSCYGVNEDNPSAFDISGNGLVGGLIGTATGSAAITQVEISKCYSVGYVTCSSDYAGGLVGYTDEYVSISNCYSRCNVTGTAAGAGGGLVGLCLASTSISYCYSTGHVEPGAAGTGLIGDSTSANDATWGYWDIETSRVADTNPNQGGVGKTTAQMKTESTFSGWDFTTIWDMDGVTNDGYPFFYVTPPTPTPAADSGLKYIYALIAKDYASIDASLLEVESYAKSALEDIVNVSTSTYPVPSPSVLDPDAAIEIEVYLLGVFNSAYLSAKDTALSVSGLLNAIRILNKFVINKSNYSGTFTEKLDYWINTEMDEHWIDTDNCPVGWKNLCADAGYDTSSWITT